MMFMFIAVCPVSVASDPAAKPLVMRSTHPVLPGSFEIPRDSAAVPVESGTQPASSVTSLFNSQPRYAWVVLKVGCGYRCLFGGIVTPHISWRGEEHNLGI